ncbi:unnamed protein product [Didymodactylos carnosus]|uniref:Uncharacterized protein n=1 Tax=Didymodactylos carnosus TaxID=1234261 RepID=A0A816BFZ9_9BILA|nr:unnamed protein product [Didymodactylos carnosus]CAF1608753.1 unnamed protein product [Didymodactylos carnosus]CAF3593638.1 unnamed protein product [Didymodactylos carnosus]CAF4490404.1 unnamed protein product [Didymodactylos carnosus]
MPSHNHGSTIDGESNYRLYYDVPVENADNNYVTGYRASQHLSGGDRFNMQAGWSNMFATCSQCRHTHKVETEGKNHAHSHKATSSTINI